LGIIPSVGPVARALAVTLALLLGVGVRPARAESDPEEQAHGRFSAGQAMYKFHRYVDAANEFLAGYALSHKPGFLLNVAQAYRAGGYRAAARDYYRRYLAEQPDLKAYRAERTEAGRILHEIDLEISIAGPGPNVPPPPDLAPKVVTRERVVTRVQVVERPARRWPLWLGISLGIVAIGAAAGVTAYFLTRQTETMLPVESLR
jgi:hypothetical protein